LRDEIQSTCRRITAIDYGVKAAAAAKHNTLTKPPGSLGRLEDLGIRIAAITGALNPRLSRKRIFVVAGDHGITSEGVSAYPSKVTHQMVLNFLSGGAAINVLGRHGDVGVQVVDAGVNYDFGDAPGLIDRKIMRGTSNFARGPAMTVAQAEGSLRAGIALGVDAARRDWIDLLGIGEMGIGNTTAASAITAVLTGRSISEVTGRGTGIDDDVLERKIAAIARGIEVNHPDPNDPIGVLAKIGGVEVGMMAGIILGAASEKLPVVADGFISTSAAALAVALCPTVRDYLFIAHKSQEAGHRALIDWIGIPALLDLEMRLGEGTGAALAMHLIDASAKILSEMATFEGAGVSNKPADVD
jgi:nicotinate-nucleotide--dimethylbenzimidazole phosphoribosyltransferase